MMFHSIFSSSVYYVSTDTGCGKTTVIQLLSFVLNQKLYAVNCHATTETSDLIGGLRPVRGRDAIKKKIVMKMKELIQSWPYDELVADLDNTIFDDVNAMVSLAKNVLQRSPDILNNESTTEHTKKKRKITESSSPGKNDISIIETEKLAMIVGSGVSFYIG